jgi:hypothetical protein
MNVIEFISPSDENVVSIRHFAGGGMVVVEQNYDKHDFAGNEKIAKLLSYSLTKKAITFVCGHILIKIMYLTRNSKSMADSLIEKLLIIGFASSIKNLTVKAQEQGGTVHVVFELKNGIATKQ